MTNSQLIWKIATWTGLALTGTWFIVTGFWYWGLAQEATDAWIGEPWGVPFIPFLDSDTLLMPFSPFYALIANSEWMPLVSMILCAGGTTLLWKAVSVVRDKAYPKGT